MNAATRSLIILIALADSPNGHIVSVRDGDDTARIWIDEQNETE